MSVVSVKVPRWLKEKMDKYRERVNWPEELRKLLIAKVEELERLEALQEALKILEKTPFFPKGTASALVREDRDSH